MLAEEIRQLILSSPRKDQLYWRNLAKEAIQNYLLKFIYQDPVWQKLIFTGGTCLRKLYGLDRLSEDLDFDYQGGFKIEIFAREVRRYFQTQLKYESLATKISGNRQTVFVKLPLYKELNLFADRTPEDLFVRCDFSPVKSKIFGITKGMISAGSFKFLVVAYDLPTLFTNKLAAFLTRNFYKGKWQKLPFKGRDVYDLFWLVQLSAKSGYRLKPEPARLLALTGLTDLKQAEDEIKRKLEKIEEKFVYQDLLSLVESPAFLDQIKPIGLVAQIIPHLPYVL